MISKHPRGAAALCALPVLFAACGGSEPPARPPEPAAVTARLGLAERLREREEIALAAVVEADRVTSVASRVMALVTAVHVRVGDEVRAGQALLAIDPTAAQGQVGAAQGALAQAEAALTLAARNHERFAALAGKNAASALELDTARMQHEQAAGAVRQARGALEAASAVARESQVLAPFAGRVASRSIEVGDLAAPGRPLLEIQSSGSRLVRAAVPEGLARRAGIAAGSTLAVSLDAHPERGTLAGEVVEMSPGPDPAAHAFVVKVALPGDEVAAGSAARLFVPGAERERVAVPRAALLEVGGLTLVVVRDEAGRAQSRLVTTGAALAGDRIEVLSGLGGGEALLLDLAAAPRSGAPVVEIR